jgi:hypothetical protein
MGGYIPCPGWPSKAAEDATIIITPLSPSSPCGVERAICGRTWRIRSIVPRTLTFITKSKSEREKGFRLRSRIYGALLVRFVFGREREGKRN